MQVIGIEITHAILTSLVNRENAGLIKFTNWFKFSSRRRQETRQAAITHDHFDEHPEGCQFRLHFKNCRNSFAEWRR
jgi:hypothetical protein